MYDTAGTDTGREWIEIYNTGTRDYLPQDIILFEEAVNHTVKPSSIHEVLAPGGYAVIADNPTKFLADNPSYSGILYDSAFSLKNTGETIEIRIHDGESADSITYVPEWGAQGNGYSLSRYGETWKETTITLGDNNGNVPSISPSTSDSENTPLPKDISPVVKDDEEEEVLPAFEVDAGKTLSTVVGAPLRLSGKAWGREGEPLSGVRYVWNLGDGSVLLGQSITHIYRHPGEYTAVLEVGYNKEAYSDRTLITVYDADIDIVDVTAGGDGYIRINNATPIEITIEGWMVQVGGSFFTFPRNTILRPHRGALYSAVSTGLIVTEGESVDLLYPNGTRVSRYSWQAHALEEDEETIEGVPFGEDVPLLTFENPAQEASPPHEDVLDNVMPVAVTPHTQSAQALPYVAKGAMPRTSQSAVSSLWLIFLGCISILAMLCIVALKKMRIPDDVFSTLTPEDFEIIEDTQEER